MARPQSFIFRSLCLLLLLVISALFSMGATTREEQRLNAINQALQNSISEQKRIKKEDSKLDNTIRKLQSQSIVIAKTGSELEKKVSSLHASLASLARQEQQQTIALTRNRKELAKMTSILYHLYKRPLRSFILYPGSQKDAVMGEILLRYWVPLIQEQVDGVEEAFDKLDIARKKTRRKLEEFTESTTLLKKQRRDLERLVASKREALSARRMQMGLIEKRLASLSQEADNLQILVDEVRVLQQAPKRRILEDSSGNNYNENIPAGVRTFPVNGHIEVPSVGKLVRAGDSGHDNELRIYTLAQAQVVAPFDGRVVHAGPFGKFGRLVMIEHLGQFHSILWSLNRIDVVRGQWVLSGEPIGSVNGKVLHMQLRRKEKPVDPIRWVNPVALAG